MTADSTPELSHNPYLDAFMTERPRDGVEQVQGQLRKALKLNEEIAEYFRERAHAEDLYAKSLAKISKKYFVSDKSALGQFLPIWEMLHKELNEVYTIHAVMSLKITEDVERPLRAAIPNDPDYNTIKNSDAHMQRITRDYDDRLARTAKHKKNPQKAGSKLAEATKAFEDTKAQWRQAGPDYIQKHQHVEEHRWQSLQSIIQNFEVLQNDQMLKRIEVANNVLTAASNFSVPEAIEAFCAAHPNKTPLAGSTVSSMPTQETARSILSLESSGTPDEPVPTPSVSDQPSQTRSKKSGKERKFLSTFVSIRRKTRSGDPGYVNADLAPPVMHHQDQLSNHSFVIDSTSVTSNDATSDMGHETPSLAPNSPVSLEPPSIHYAPSITGSLASSNNAAPSSPAPPKVQVDSEGYTIPPEDRTAWPSEAGVSLHDDESDNGSVLSAQQRIKVDIRTEAKEEDATQSAVALTRVSSLLKEKGAAGPTKRRGRREMRSTRLLDPVQESGSAHSADAPALTAPTAATSLASPLSSPIPAPRALATHASEAASPFEDVAEAGARIQVQIVETVHAQLREGEAVRSAVWGEVKITYNGPAELSSPVCFRLDHVASIERVTPNSSYVAVLEDNVYALQTSMFHLAAGSPVACIKYQAKVEAYDQVVPIWVQPMWKCEEKQSRLLVKYHKTAVPLAEAVHGVFFMTSAGGNVQQVQSSPPGQWMVDQQRMVWPIGEVTQDTMTLRAQFSTLQAGTPQPLAIRFEAKDTLVSRLQLVPHSQNLEVESTEKSVRSGKFMAEVKTVE
ncbi:Muniscin C-terminal mu homology domain-domain-containing protein [Syncephalastrum racemosum]|uniref:Muniscin C-terminal mu homology domain-domain-containing protein n=1 Tax=Syncephalastrum racemosum TaxID=13706 RepID=A0A1X2HGW7_SYNRA|nr:Muniscin C-terminal mu homology domain-domain-containing protein [Syncephalastrum racemosum]